MSKVKKDTFVFYRSYYDSISRFPEGVQFLLFRAIVRYGLDLEEPDFTGAQFQPFVEAVWDGIRPHLYKSYTNWLNGNKGGPPKGNKNNPHGRRGNGKQPRTNLESTENRPKDKDKDNDKDKDKDNDNEQDNVRDIGIIIDDWRHLSNARLDQIRITGQSVANFKRSLLLQEVNDVAAELGLSRTDIEAFMQKWGESSPGSEMIRAEYEPTFNTKERAKNYKGVGKPVSRCISVQELMARG